MNLAMGFEGRLGDLRDRAVGWAVLHAMPRLRDALLASWAVGGADLGGRRRELFAALARAIERTYYAPGTPSARRAEIRHLCHGFESGLRAAERDERCPAAPAARSALDGEIDARLCSGRVRTVHQVACGSGRALAAAAARFPAVFFCGSDGNPLVVDFCRRRWRHLPNLAFTTLRLENTHDRAVARSLQADLVVANGGLHLLDEAELRACFDSLRRWCPVLLVSQPVAPDFDVAGTPWSEPRPPLGWSHPYPLYLREAGWENVRATEEVPSDTPDRKLVAAFASDATHALRAA